MKVVQLLMKQVLMVCLVSVLHPSNHSLTVFVLLERMEVAQVTGEGAIDDESVGSEGVVSTADRFAYSDNDDDHYLTLYV